MTKWVFAFGGDQTEGSADMRALLGGKGANLAEMANLGLPVPPGFTLTTQVCTHFYQAGETYPPEVAEQVEAAIAHMENILDARLGDPMRPLLVSVRSGARASMPGMMDTVLNLGLNERTAEGLIARTGNARFVYDSYRRFLQMYGDVVLGIEHQAFESILDQYKEKHDKGEDTHLSAENWREVVDLYRAMIQDRLGKPFPDDAREQLWGAIGAVFKSWMTPRAVHYRQLHRIPEDWGTAVNVQAMVFGNLGDDSATGVCFTRNPSTGDNYLYGEYLVNAQGEDVVAGIRTPHPLSLHDKRANQRAGDGPQPKAMEEELPKAFAELMDIRQKLEVHYKDLQDMEFTVQDGKLWMLQTRAGKRTPRAALKIAVDMCREGLITHEQAIARIDPSGLNLLLHPVLDPEADRTIIGRGLPASPGAATGRIVFRSEEAEEWAGRGEKIILVRDETSPADIVGMHVAEGILTTKGGMTSHAAVVTRGWGTPCVVGASTIRVDVAGKTLRALGHTLGEGDVITVDGTTGEIVLGDVPKIQPEMSGDFAELMGWVDSVRRLGVRANAETPEDARHARTFGAEGIGLCRTEHMFFEPDRIIHMREMILAGSEDERRSALDKLLPYQRQDFMDLFEIMEGLPVTIRLLDPPLNEFLPHLDEDIRQVAEAAGVGVDVVRARVAELDENNPMLGHRGCRLGISYPEIYEMQAQAIFEAVVEQGRKGEQVIPEVMIPLIATGRELEVLKALVDRVAERVMAESGSQFTYHVGTMIELPRAALRAGEIAETAEFFSFGTNDLTQTTYGLSRDDSGRFLRDYLEKGVLTWDPFTTIDQDGVGELMKLASARGRATRANLKLGICGEHGGDPASVAFCHEIGLDYVSCSPFRVPVARLAAAQAALGMHDTSTD